MRTFATNKGPFREGVYYTDGDIEQMVLDELQAVGLLPKDPEPIRIDRFIEKRFKISHSYGDLGPDILGITKFGPKGVQEIVVAESLEDGTTVSERRVRTTLGHEAGHGLLHAHLFVLGNAKPLFGDWSDANAPKVLRRGEDRVSRSI